MNTQSANEAIRNGSMAQLVQQTMEKLKPEAAYFTTVGGRRTALFVFDMAESSQMPAVAEEFFLELDADVSYQPVMDFEDLRRGMAALQR
ncbi:hypothetical protein E4099_10870 [Streptomyces palmae]|uniref:DUF3303 domain-containing protein n=2 Tax=Streptomyces palmae TaxID=1701085 RepID=A0A4Z0HEB6_9ACTN|nr:hypothetical protein E4099_10870 [Streptomyces palmae]